MLIQVQIQYKYSIITIIFFCVFLENHEANKIYMQNIKTDITCPITVSSFKVALLLKVLITDVNVVELRKIGENEIKKLIQFIFNFIFMPFFCYSRLCEMVIYVLMLMSVSMSTVYFCKRSHILYNILSSFSSWPFILFLRIFFFASIGLNKFYTKILHVESSVQQYFRAKNV